MKYSLFALAAVVARASAEYTHLNPGGMPNAIYETSWGDWVWCCGDSDGACPDACARTNQEAGEYWYDTWGPGSTNYQDQEEGKLDAPTIESFVDFPEDGFTNADFVSMKCRMIHGFKCCGSPGVCGDPHFKTWAGEFFDYQGQCELKFLDAPDFGQGTGLLIHIRTKIQNSYSFIESAAIQIGNDVLEVGSWGEYFLNGVESAELPAMMGGFPVSYFQRSEKEHIFDIFLGDNRRILIKNLKEWVSIHLDNPSDQDFLTSTGMMGDFMEGKLMARDGKTVMTDENAFGQEWQVQPTEPQLFQRSEFEPKAGAQCILPLADGKSAEAQRRLLEERGITREKAEAVCQFMPAHKEFCVEDVLATGDLDVAGAF